MNSDSISQWQHTHVFGQDQIRSGERRTLLVIIITGIMMVGEIITGIIFGSMALTADGIHMGSHMVGLGITFFAYIYARKHAQDQLYSFGTGKVNALAGYSSAMILIFIAFFMAYESFVRVINPVEILYNKAILVAVIGLIVNGISMVILGEKGHTHAHGDHDHETLDPTDDENADHDHEVHTHAGHEHVHIRTGDDHNLKAAYLHVFTDAMTSVLAIVALLAAKYFHLVWMDPLMGIVGALLVIRWSVGLIQGTTKVLLDHQSPAETQQRITEILESYKDTKVSDLHIWSIGPGIYSSEITLVTNDPDSPNTYKEMIPHDSGIVHTTVEVHSILD
ncbi:MAG: cation diffusion facilitator family transporter [Chloroflexi bacterium RBG_13_50_21]|nr:MAG: cation diffusion facilitator family transporter [Chloroflexi bacterium RBG_13_50_21]OGO61305.1 MAG: cation diffusion facilitator family transporter [Chloroflexi bacterium RBG_19FT_COMBO_47_9]